MSGPIVRKYGFPNFEKIFGERELKHGAADEPAKAADPSTPPEPSKDAEVTQPDPGAPSSANPNQGA